MKVVLASQNQGKLREMQAILGKLGFEVVLQSDLGVHIDVEETGETFEENSLLKAKAVMEQTGLAAIADDSGLVVDALGGAPGVYSARYCGLATDEERLYRVLENMENVPDAQRTARFVSVITMLIPGKEPLVARGECEGLITRAPAGTGGFGYDPIFYTPSEKMTFSQITSQRKNEISHRARALFRLADLLKQEGYHADK